MKSYQNDPEYLWLSRDWHLARNLMPILIQKQFQTREDLRLAMISEDKEEVIRLRKELMKNRKGKSGLRSLNWRIRAYYRYCERKGIFPY